MKNQLIILLSSLYFSTAFAEVQTTTTTTNSAPSEPTVIINNNGEGAIVTKPSTTTTTTTTTTNNLPTPVDEAIITAVYTNYAQAPALIGTALNVTSLNGIVTIEGVVTAQAQADSAIEQAQAVPGVKEVRSRITVSTNPNLNNPKPPIPNY